MIIAYCGGSQAEVLYLRFGGTGQSDLPVGLLSAQAEDIQSTQ